MDNPANYAFFQLLRFLDKYHPDAIPVNVLLDELPLIVNRSSTIRKCLTDAGAKGYIKQAKVSANRYDSSKLAYCITEDGQLHLQQWLVDIPLIEHDGIINADIFNSALDCKIPKLRG